MSNDIYEDKAIAKDAKLVPAQPLLEPAVAKDYDGLVQQWTTDAAGWGKKTALYLNANDMSDNLTMAVTQIDGQPAIVINPAIAQLPAQDLSARLSQALAHAESYPPVIVQSGARLVDAHYSRSVGYEITTPEERAMFERAWSSKPINVNTHDANGDPGISVDNGNATIKAGITTAVGNIPVISFDSKNAEIHTLIQRDHSDTQAVYDTVQKFDAMKKLSGQDVLLYVNAADRGDSHISHTEVDGKPGVIVNMSALRGDQTALTAGLTQELKTIKSEQQAQEQEQLKAMNLPTIKYDAGHDEKIDVPASTMSVTNAVAIPGRK